MRRLGRGSAPDGLLENDRIEVGAIRPNDRSKRRILETHAARMARGNDRGCRAGPSSTYRIQDSPKGGVGNWLTARSRMGVDRSGKRRRLEVWHGALKGRLRVGAANGDKKRDRNAGVSGRFSPIHRRPCPQGRNTIRATRCPGRAMRSNYDIARPGQPAAITTPGPAPSPLLRKGEGGGSCRFYIPVGGGGGTRVARRAAPRASHSNGSIRMRMTT